MNSTHKGKYASPYQHEHDTIRCEQVIDSYILDYVDPFREETYR